MLRRSKERVCKTNTCIGCAPLKEEEKPVYPSVICSDCAVKYGGKMVKGHIATYSLVRCDCCGRLESCTEPRDWGHLPLHPAYYIKKK